MTILVLPYTNPDLDGTACAFAYAEFLSKHGKDAIAAVFGNPGKEARFVLNKYGIPALADASILMDSADEIAIVDASDVRGLPPKIRSEKVTEIIDHRKVHDAHMFPNAKVQIELVGSAATLIGEKYHYSQTPISQESAALLYSAIVSNTINFKANVTTPRDLKMAGWLKTRFHLPPGYIHEIFLDKSNLPKTSFGFATFTFNGQYLGIAQREMIGVDRFVKENISEIKKALHKFKQEKSLDFIFLTCIDLEDAKNEIVIVDTPTQKLLEQVLDVRFKDGVAKRDGILMRKELVPMIKDALESGKRNPLNESKLY